MYINTRRNGKVTFGQMGNRWIASCLEGWLSANLVGRIFAVAHTARAIANRRDQRAFRSGFTGGRSALSPSRPRPFRCAPSATSKVSSGYDTPELAPDRDLLDRRRFVAELSTLIGDTPAEWSVRIGVFGKWGSERASCVAAR